MTSADSGDGTAGDVVDQDGRRLLPDISSRAFEHPADRAALATMRGLTGFEQVVKVASSMLRERRYRLAYLASAVRVDERQFGRIDQAYSDALAILDVPERPELYVYQGPYASAETLGVDKPFIALSSTLVDLLTIDEVRLVLGHELGHAMSGHALYKTLLHHVLNLIGSLGWIPIGGIGLRVLLAALREWDRKSELSADRAGLLVAQDADVSLAVHMKLAAGAHVDDLDTEAFLAQAAEYDAASGDLRDGILKLLNTERSRHPFAVTRAGEIRRWVGSGDYDRILAGDYARRTDDKDASTADAAKDAARNYKERIDSSADPVAGAVRNISGTVGAVADGIGGWMSRTFATAADAGAAGSDARGTAGGAAGDAAGEDETTAGSGDRG